MRYFIEITYNGKNYCGWQKQPEDLSVQEVLEHTLSTLSGGEIKVTGAGRTDAGVHAKQFFAHFDSTEIVHTNDLIFRLNSFLPKDIAVKSLVGVQSGAHARFDAVQREYEYRITFQKDPFLKGFAHFLHQKPNLKEMNKAAKMLLAHNDFQCFSRSKTDVKTYHCSIEKASWEMTGDELVFTISADRFLRNMVRAVVGTLLDVGYGKTTLETFNDILNSKDRSRAGASVPAHGLYLTKVRYPETIF